MLMQCSLKQVLCYMDCHAFSFFDYKIPESCGMAHGNLYITDFFPNFGDVTIVNLK